MFRHHHQVSTAVALALALAAVAPAAASARLELNPPAATSQTQTRPAVDLRSPDARDLANAAVRVVHTQGARVRREFAARSAASSSGTGSPPPVQIVKVSQPFDWGDAGIGAAVGLALSMIGLGGALAVSQRRTHRTPA